MQITRRTLLTTAALGALGWSARSSTALSALALGQPDKRNTDHVLISVFLRGGADGLSLVPPYTEDDYYRLRPTLAIQRPARGAAASSGRAVDLDGQFGLHPSLTPLLPLFQDGQLAIVHACGSGDQTRSHFDAMATMECGLNQDIGGAASGWMARHLSMTEPGARSPLRAVAVGDVVPQTLVGATGATAMQSLADATLDMKFGARDNAAVISSLRSLYGSRSSSAIGTSGVDALEVLQKLEQVSPNSYKPSNGANYPSDDFGAGLRLVSMLIKSRVGLEAACLDHAGYDTHFGQGGSTGILSSRLSSLAEGLSALRADLGPQLWANTTVVVLSEFGRRVEENSSLGTDHGRGGVMMVAGGTGVRGGKLYGRWPTLAPGKLEGPGDVTVTTDYRDVLTEVLRTRCGNGDAAQVFPGLNYSPLGLAYG